MSKRLFDFSGGDPKIYAGEITPSTWVTIISAVSGKIIVPVWMLMYTSNEAGLDGVNQEDVIINMRYTGYSDNSRNQIRSAIMSDVYENDVFINLGESHFSNDYEGMGLEAKINTTKVDYKTMVTVGYYLVDANV